MKTKKFHLFLPDGTHMCCLDGIEKVVRYLGRSQKSILQNIKRQCTTAGIFVSTQENYMPPRKFNGGIDIDDYIINDY